MTEAQSSHMQQRVTALRSEAFSVAEELRQSVFLEGAKDTDLEAMTRLQNVANMLGHVESLMGGCRGGQRKQAEALTTAA